MTPPPPPFSKGHGQDFLGTRGIIVTIPLLIFFFFPLPNLGRRRGTEQTDSPASTGPHELVVD